VQVLKAGDGKVSYAGRGPPVGVFLLSGVTRLCRDFATTKGSELPSICGRKRYLHLRHSCLPVVEVRDEFKTGAAQIMACTHALVGHGNDLVLLIPPNFWWVMRVGGSHSLYARPIGRERERPATQRQATRAPAPALVSRLNLAPYSTQIWRAFAGRFVGTDQPNY
jgi:hypothetical protein